MLRKILNINWVAWALFLCSSSSVLGSGGSLISAGALNSPGGSETGYRQLVELKTSGKIFNARPRKGQIRLITLVAPGLIEGHLIIRELDLHGNGVSVLISAPKKIHAQIKRATIFLESASNGMSLYQENEYGWERIEPIPLIATHAPIEGNSKALSAYTVSQLGNFRISNNSAIQQTISDYRMFPMGSVRTGVFPWICAGALFAAIGILSYVIHKMEQQGAN